MKISYPLVIWRGRDCDENETLFRIVLLSSTVFVCEVSKSFDSMGRNIWEICSPHNRILAIAFEELFKNRK